MRVEYLEAGEIVSTHGVRGEVKVLPWGDGPDFLTGFDRVQISGKEYRVEGCRIQKTCNLLKLSGVESIEDAQALRGKTVEVYREDAPKDMVFVAELIGIKVYADGAQIGEVKDVLDYPGNKVYVVEGEYSYMIPAVKEFVLSLDVEKEELTVKLIEGMRTDES